jgi:very-short-patch-repair endonuclease
LGAGWFPEQVVKTHRKPPMYPHCYKLDLANPELMIGIELDGGSHLSLTRREQDQKKDALLRSFGWKVLRLKNSLARSLFITSESLDIQAILRMAS